MPSRRSVGVSGSAVLFGTAGLYLVYIGLNDVGFVDGMRKLLRKERPLTKSGIAVGSKVASAGGTPIGNVFIPGGGSKGALGLVGNAAEAHKTWVKLFPGMTMYGLGARPKVPESDHPKGLAIDLMTSDEKNARIIINIFMTQRGAKYWIWNRQKGSALTLWIPMPYTGENPHTDHVHLSYY